MIWADHHREAVEIRFVQSAFKGPGIVWRPAGIYDPDMTQERLATIWSLYRRGPVLVRVRFRLETGILRIECIEELGE